MNNVVDYLFSDAQYCIVIWSNRKYHVQNLQWRQTGLLRLRVAAESSTQNFSELFETVKTSISWRRAILLFHLFGPLNVVTMSESHVKWCQRIFFFFFLVNEGQLTLLNFSKEHQTEVDSVPVSCEFIPCEFIYFLDGDMSWINS